MADAGPAAHLPPLGNPFAGYRGFRAETHGDACLRQISFAPQVYSPKLLQANSRHACSGPSSPARTGFK